LLVNSLRQEVNTTAKLQAFPGKKRKKKKYHPVRSSYHLTALKLRALVMMK